MELVNMILHPIDLRTFRKFLEVQITVKLAMIKVINKKTKIHRITQKTIHSIHKYFSTLIKFYYFRVIMNSKLKKMQKIKILILL